MAFAQSAGQITGTVTDSSGAVVPGAQVVIVNLATNVKTELTSNDSGLYSATGLAVGKYKVSVTSKGFKTTSQDNVNLNVDDKLTVNFALTVGSVSEQVSVEAAQVTIDLQNGSVEATTISGQQIRELALVTRNYEQLVALMPGVTRNNVDQLYKGVSLPSGATATIPYSINGGRNSQNSWLVDGADNEDRGSNLTLLTTPSIDAIAEFKVQRSGYSAEYGRSGAGQVEVVTKSGGTQFHGNAYEFVRNNDFAANNFYSNATLVNLGPDGKAAVPPLRYNDFGWTLGGPLFVPKVYPRDKSKTFFFFSEEFNRVITYSTATAIAPTALELTGVFPHAVCVSRNSAGACVTTSNTIPAASISPVAATYIKDIFNRTTLPTGTSSLGPNSIVNPLRNVYNFEQELYKIDHVFGDKLQISARFLRDQIPTVEPTGIFSLGANLPNTGITNTNSPGQQWTVRALSAFGPTWTNELGWNYSYGAILSQSVGLANKTLSPDINPKLPFSSTLLAVPTLALGGGTSIAGYGPYRDFNRNQQIYDNVSKSHGTHTTKFGFVYYHYQKTENASGGNQGSFSITSTAPAGGATTFEQSVADFLLGQVATFTQASQDITPDMRANMWEVYVQDDWKVKSNFTVNLGLRYSRFRQPTDANRELTTFDPVLYDAGKAANVLTSAGNLAATVALPYLNGIAINDQTSRFGSKISSEDNANIAPRIGIAWDPFKTGKTAIRAGYGVFYDATLYGIYEQNIFANPPYVNSVTISGTTLDNPSGGTTSVSLATKALRGTTSDMRTPYTQQWNLEVQRQFGSSTQLNIAYVGTKATHLLGIIDLNQLPPGFAYTSGFAPATTYYASSATETVLNLIRPYKGYNAVNVIEPWFNSNYHALQIYGQKRFHGESLVSFSYTWSHNLTDAQSDRSSAPQNTYNFHDGEYGNAAIDQRHVFSLNFVYELPFFRKQEGFTGKVLGGWQVSGIAQYNAGLDGNTVTTSNTDPAALGLLGSSASSARPNMICNPNDNAPHTRFQWFNTACFQQVPTTAGSPHVVGNEGRGVIVGPGYEGWSFSAAKNVHFGNEGRYWFQLRGDASNALNHSNPNGIASLNITGGTAFGQISSYRDPRIIQLGAKFYF